MTPSNLEILAYEQTPLGMLCLRRRRPLHDPDITVTEITLNNEFLMSSYYTDSEQALAKIALDMHGGQDLDILIGGLGLGYTAYETLISEQAKSVDVIEFLPQVIEWTKDGLIPLSKDLNMDRRLNIVHSDVYERMLTPPKQKYDVILIDVDHSPDERLDSKMGHFYTREGLAVAKEHLNVGGILGVWSYAEDSPFADALRVVYSEVKIEPISFIHKCLNNQQHTDWLFFARL